MSESRFDDLDLREEPPSATKTEEYTSYPPAAGNADASVLCTRACCV
jgi:hypothetical protein